MGDFRGMAKVAGNREAYIRSMMIDSDAPLEDTYDRSTSDMNQEGPSSAQRAKEAFEERMREES